MSECKPGIQGLIMRSAARARRRSSEITKMPRDWRWSLIVITLTVAPFGKPVQAAMGNDVCTGSNRTQMIATLRGGTRVLLELERNGDRMTGMATLWLANGRMPARGPVTGMFGGRELDDVTRGFALSIHWQAPTNADSDLSGFMNRGTGRGNAYGLKGNSVEPVPLQISTRS